MSTESPLHPKRAGSNVEAVVIDTEPGLEYVGDSEAEWHDAQTTKLLTPTAERPVDGVCVVEDGTPTEIKAVIPEHQNGRSGTFYIRRKAHDQLLDAGGVYYLTVYAPKPDTPLLASRITPAATVDRLLQDYWYDNGRREVAKLSWPRVISKDRVYGGGV